MTCGCTINLTLKERWERGIDFSEKWGLLIMVLSMVLRYMKDLIEVDSRKDISFSQLL